MLVTRVLSRNLSKHAKILCKLVQNHFQVWRKIEIKAIAIFCVIRKRKKRKANAKLSALYANVKKRRAIVKLCVLQANAIKGSE